MSTPDLHLQTAFVLNGAGRIVSTREPGPTLGPLFTLIRSTTSCAWAVRADVPADVARELDGLAREEPPVAELRDIPVYADRYAGCLSGWMRSGEPPGSVLRPTAGPAFAFPDAIAQPDGVMIVEDETLLQHHFRGWVAGEIAAGRAPVMAIFDGGYPVSVCFSARRSDVAAEAGLETAEAFRGRGSGARVTAAWALAMRASGRIPLYSTAWTNHASRAVRASWV